MAGIIRPPRLNHSVPAILPCPTPLPYTPVPALPRSAPPHSTQHPCLMCTTHCAPSTLPCPTPNTQTVRPTHFAIYTLSCPALPCPALPCPVLLCPTLPCPALPCAALPCPALCCAALPCAALFCPALRCPGLACLALRCAALPCAALPCAALPSPALPWPAAEDEVVVREVYPAFDTQTEVTFQLIWAPAGYSGSDPVFVSDESKGFKPLAQVVMDLPYNTQVSRVGAWHSTLGEEGGVLYLTLVKVQYTGTMRSGTLG